MVRYPGVNSSAMETKEKCQCSSMDGPRDDPMNQLIQIQKANSLNRRKKQKEVLVQGIVSR